MTLDQQTLIIKWQFLAAILMGLDYFMSDSWRERANAAVAAYFSGVQERVDSDLNRAWQYVLGKSPRIVASLAAMAVGYGALYVVKQPELADYEALNAIVRLISMCFVGGGFLSLFSIFLDILTPVGIGGFFRIFTTFILGSSKGPLAAIGFMCLLISFWLGYSYTANA